MTKYRLWSTSVNVLKNHDFLIMLFQWRWQELAQLGFEPTNEDGAEDVCKIALVFRYPGAKSTVPMVIAKVSRNRRGSVMALGISGGVLGTFPVHFGSSL